MPAISLHCLRLHKLHRSRAVLIRHVPPPVQTMHETGADFTNTFRWLSEVPLPAPSSAGSHPGTAQTGQSNGAAQSETIGAEGSASGTWPPMIAASYIL